MDDGVAANAAAAGAVAAEEIEAEIARLIAPGLRANRWRSNYEAFRQRRLWDENYHGRRLRVLHREFRGLAGGRILDVGSGRGGLSVAMWRAGYHVVALDLRESCCRVARLRGQRYGLHVPVVKARGEQLPFRGESFAAVICRDVLEHSARPAQLLAEIWRVLRPGGRCYVTVINRLCWVDPHYHLAGISFLPRRLAEAYIAFRRRSKQSVQDHQRLSDMNYYYYAEFLRLAKGFGFSPRNLGGERRYRSRRNGLVNGLRWLGGLLLRPLSLQSSHFELLLSKDVCRDHAKGAK